jgi:small Trp-rich protein
MQFLDWAKAKSAMAGMATTVLAARMRRARFMVVVLQMGGKINDDQILALGLRKWDCHYDWLQTILGNLQRLKMWFLYLGILLWVFKWLAIEPVAAWSWWWLMSPFAMAAAWWWLADISGYTRRKATQQEAVVRRTKLNRNRQKLGLPPLKD